MLHLVGLGQLTGGLLGVARGLQAEVVFQGKLHPGRAIGRHRRVDGEVVLEHVEFTVCAAGEHRQALQRNGYVVFIDDAVDLGEVAGGLRFIHVRDGDQPYLETLLGLLQLALEGFFRSARCRQVVLRTQHQQVGFCHAHNQVLLVGGEGRLGLLGEFLARLEGEPGRQVEQGLVEAHFVAVAGGVDVGNGLYGFQATADAAVDRKALVGGAAINIRIIIVSVYLRQQCRQAQVLCFQIGFVLCLFGFQLRIVGQCQLVDVAQGLRPGGSDTRAECERQQCGSCLSHPESSVLPVL